MIKVKKKQGFAGQRTIELDKKTIKLLIKQYPSIKNGYFTNIGFYPDAKFQFIENKKGREEYILIYCVKGYGNAKVNQKTYHLSPGDFFLIPANSPFSYHADELNPWSIFWFFYKGAAIKEISDLFIKENQTHKGFLAYNEERVKLFNRIYQNLERGYGTDNLTVLNMCLLHFVSSFVLIMPSHKILENKKQTIVNTSIQLMKAHCEGQLTLIQLAENANMSVSHFSLIFKNQTGIAPLIYFNNLKMQKACDYLKFTDILIKEISYKIGIADAQYFSRIFKKNTGMSPKVYRKSFTV